jgi:hypothetical protein
MQECSHGVRPQYCTQQTCIKQELVKVEQELRDVAMALRIIAHRHRPKYKQIAIAALRKLYGRR